MSVQCVGQALGSGQSDLDGVPIDAEVTIDDAEYARIMRRIHIGSDEPDGVSAFNSSI